MTSSDASPPQHEPRTPRVLAAGHLHPGILFLSMFDAFRASILPAVLGLLAQQTFLLALAPVVFLFTMGRALVMYLVFRYALTEEELVTTQGVLHRQERRIPVDRIQDLNFESSLLRRVFGLVVVSVETASGKGAEASLDSLGRRDAEQLREALHLVRSRRGFVRETQDAPEELAVYRATAAELALLGLTSNRVGAILVGVFAVLEFADELGLGATVIGAGSDLAERVAAQSPPLVLVFVAVALFLLLLAGWLVAIVASFVKFHGFTLALRDDVLQRRFGLITTRVQSLPRRRVQRVLLEQNLLRRLLDFAVVRADSAGSGMDSKEETRSGRDVIAPLTSRVVGERLVPWLLRDVFVEDLEFTRVSPRVVGRIFAQGALLALVLLAVGAWTVGAWSALALVLLPVAWLFGCLAYRNLGFRELDEHVALRWGILGRYRAFLPLHKVQAVRLEAGPIDRAFGLASLVVYVAGGSPTRLDHLPRDQAERLELAIAERAARSRFVW